MDVGLPEQAVKELDDYKSHWRHWEECKLDCSNREAFLVAKGMALQQAGHIPINTDIEMMTATVFSQSELEGLLKGY